MKHPLEFVPPGYRKGLFLTFLFLTVVLFAVFSVLDQPLRTPASPNGIVSFELARTPAKAQSIVDVWSGRTILFTDGEHQNAVTAQAGEPFTYTPIPIIHASFGLGIDYLFMPLYALALAFGTLLAAGRHSGWLKSLGTAAGYAAFSAVLFDAVENYALLQILFGVYNSTHPALAAVCASIKFGLLLLGVLYAFIAGLIPGKK